MSRSSATPKRTRIAVCTLPILALTGCGAGPSEGDLDRVLRSSIDQERAAANAQAPGLGTKLYPKVHGIKKLGCKEESINAFACDVELDIDQPNGSRAKRPTTVRIAKGSDGWAPMR